MGKASSAKKIKRVQQAGATRSPGQRRQLGYPALIAVILVVGLSLSFLAVRHRRVVERDEPAVGTVWHEAFGLFVCGEFQDTLQPVDPEAPIVLYPDGLIRVAPDGKKSAGANATFSLFLEAMGIEVTDTSLKLPDGTIYNNGDDCGGQPGRVALYDWPPQTVDKTEPRIISSAIPGTRFTADGRSYVLAFAPRGAEVSPPPSADALDNPSDEKPKKAETTTTAAGSTESTAAGETTTTAAGTPTTAPEATTTTAGG